MALFKTVYSSSAQELGADGLGLASLPAEPVGGLFEKRGGFGRCCERAPPSTPSGRAFGTPARGQPPSRTPGGSSSLFDRYGADSSGFGRPASAGGTATSRLRERGLKLTCYLNGEANRTAAVAVAVPEKARTLKEVLPLIQATMRLDRRMLYVRELYLPDGERIGSMKKLSSIAVVDAPVIVGCGEPFDPQCIPPSMLSVHLQGGGRDAARLVKKQLVEKKLKGCQLKADQVRASGHGTSTTAARLARNGAVEGNRQSAAQLRHEHVRHMLQRAEQQEAVHRTTASRAMSERRAREARLSARSRRDPRFDRGRVKVAGKLG